MEAERDEGSPVPARSGSVDLPNIGEAGLSVDLLSPACLCVFGYLLGGWRQGEAGTWLSRETLADRSVCRWRDSVSLTTAAGPRSRRGKFILTPFRGALGCEWLLCLSRHFKVVQRSRPSGKRCAIQRAIQRDPWRAPGINFVTETWYNRVTRFHDFPLSATHWVVSAWDACALAMQSMMEVKV